MKIKHILFLILACITLTSCPPTPHYTYTCIDKDVLEINDRFTILKLNDTTQIKISCGFYNNYLGDYERGVEAKIIINDHTNHNFLETIATIKSLEFGELKHLKTSDNGLNNPFSIYYKKRVRLKRENKIAARVLKDTITINFKTGKTLLFIGVQ